MPTLETNQYGTWIGKQSAKGTPNASPSKRLIQVGGEVGLQRDDGSEKWSDLLKYGSETDWLNSLMGGGELALEATPTELAYLLWLFHGAEAYAAETVVTGPPAIPAMARHRFTPSTGLGYYFTQFQRVGSTNPRRHQNNDCIITKIVMEMSSANKAMRVTPTILSLDPALPYTSDPAVNLPTDRPFLFTDFGQVGSAPAATIDGSLVIDGTTFRGITQFSLTIDDAWAPIFGDNVTPYDFQQGDPSVAVGATLYFDAVGQAQWNNMVYGTTTPSAGQRPQRGIPALGSFLGTVRQRTAAGAHSGREVIATVPGVKWTLPPAPGPSADGGVAEIALSGLMRPTDPTGTVKPYTIDVKTNTADVAFTV